MVGVAGLEPAASWSRTKHATNCATPRYCRDIIVIFSPLVKSLVTLRTGKRDVCGFYLVKRRGLV